MINIYGCLNTLFEDLKRIESTRNIKVAFVSIIKGVEKGVARYYSDIDLRVCFYNNDLSIPDNDDSDFENSIHFVEHFSNRPYDSISFWEIHNFFGFLACPAIDKRVNYHLANAVYESILSPFIIDFFGLKDLITDYLNVETNIRFERFLLQEELNKFASTNNKQKLVHSIKTFIDYLRIKWIDVRNEIAPYSLKRLISLVSPEEKQCLNVLLEELKERNTESIATENMSKDFDVQNYSCIKKLNSFISSLGRAEVPEYVLDLPKKERIVSIIHQAILDNIKADFFWAHFSD